MKKAILNLIVAVLVLTILIYDFIARVGNNKPQNFIFLGITVILVAFAVYVGFRKAESASRGEPAEDELSKKVIQKTSSISFYISIYLWLFIMYFSDKFNFEPHVFIAAGILGMAIVFACCWLFYNFRGIKNE